LSEQNVIHVNWPSEHIESVKLVDSLGETSAPDVRTEKQLVDLDALLHRQRSLLAARSAQDMFVAGLSSSGAWTWAKLIESTGQGYAGLAANKQGDLILAGYFQQSITLGGKTHTSQGDYDIFAWSVGAPKP